MPVIPVVMRVERSAGGRAEDQVTVFPRCSRRQAFGILASPLIPELGGKRRRYRQDELRLSPAGLDALAAGEVPASPGALATFACVPSASLRAWPLHLGAAVPALDAVGGTADPVPVLCAVLRAGRPVTVLGAGGKVPAAVPVASPPELPADLDGAGVQVHVLPAEPNRLRTAGCPPGEPPTSGRRCAGRRQRRGCGRLPRGSVPRCHSPHPPERRRAWPRCVRTCRVSRRP
jgi:hypothetical protein